MIFSWAVFWVAAALAPFCDDWAAIEAAAGHAAHHATPAPAKDDRDATQGGTQCCHTLSDASVDDPKPELAQAAKVLGPITAVAWTSVAPPSAGATFSRVAPAPRSRLPVFLNTRRLRI